MFKSIRTGSSKNPITVCGVFADCDSLPSSLKSINKQADGVLADALKTPGFKADAGEIVIAGEKHLLIGLGEAETCNLNTLRIVGARLVKKLDRMETNAVELAIGLTVTKKIGNADEVAQAIAEGMALANWRVDFFDGSATKTPNVLAALTVQPHDAKYKDGLKRGLAMAASTNYARRIAATPPNICNPTFMAKEARRMACETGLTCKVINYSQAKTLGLGGIVNVGKASESKPCLIMLEHKPSRISKNAKGEKIALVGKTITYDTGGYSLKISNGMKGMKYDKNGGMAVLGAMHAIATLKLPIHVVAFLPAAENMVGGDAYRPDDIITMYNGVSVEVTNTDAEGRLVLADALAYACKKTKPTAIVDLATLTGGVVVALGSWCAGLWCDDDKLRKRIDSASKSTGERVWELPLWSDHREFMRSKHADIWNSGPKRDGHPIQGAAFLSYFVDEDIPWAHIDIAGVSAVDSDTDMFVMGPTGFGVRLMTEFVAGYA